MEDGQVERSAIDPAGKSRLYDDPDKGIAARARKLLEDSGSDRAKVIESYHDAVTLAGEGATHGK